MSKDFLLQFAQGIEIEPCAPLPIECEYEFYEETREIKIISCKTLSKGAPNFFIGRNTPNDSIPTDEDLNKAINEYLKNETQFKYSNQNKRPTDIYIEVFGSGVPIAHSEDEIDIEHDYSYITGSGV